VLGKRPQRLDDLFEGVVGAPLERERDALDGEELHGVRSVRPVLDGGRLPRQLGGAVELATHEGACPREEARAPAELGQAEIVGHLPVCGDLALGLLDVAALEEIGDAPAPRDQLDLALARPRRHGSRLGRERGALRGRVGSPDREVAADERRGEHVVTTEAPRHRQRLGREGGRPRALGREVEGLAEPPEEVRAQRRVGGRDRPERLLEQPHERPIDGARLDARVAEAEGGTRE